jgi:hypothetical protein
MFIGCYLPFWRAWRMALRSRSISPSATSTSDMRSSAVTACSGDPAK